MPQITYTIGVKRRFFGVTEYKCHAHRLETLGSAGQLVMNLADGSELHVPDIGNKSWRVYPDYQTEQKRAAEWDNNLQAHAQNLARDIDMQRQQAAMNMQARRMQSVGAQIPVQG